MSSGEAAHIRAGLKHPVIDCDGHWREPAPVLLDYIRQVGGADVAARFRLSGDLLSWGPEGRGVDWYQATPQERLRKRLRRTAWCTYPADAVDNATSRLPALFYDRMDELGIDFAVVYPTFSFGFEAIREEELRDIAFRAFNTMAADLFRPFADRLAPVAAIPRWTPEEASREATFAVRELGMKVICVNGAGMRTVPDSNSRYVDTLGLDNGYDYDSFFKTCVDLKVAITAHGGALTWPNNASATNFTFNHVGHFAEANHAFAKAVFLGGVPRRFPELQFAFLEGGVGWARNLLCDLIGHWEKRTPEALRQFLQPDKLDVGKLRELIVEHGDGPIRGKVDDIIAGLGRGNAANLSQLTAREKDNFDDFEAIGVHSKRELAQEYARNFYFGCEADDPMTMLAFDKRMGQRLKPLFSSDFSHWDVQVMADVLPEAYEMVEKGWVDDQDFREFVFTNAAALHSSQNPDFFKGTVIEQAVADELRSRTLVA